MAGGVLSELHKAAEAIDFAKRFRRVGIGFTGVHKASGRSCNRRPAIFCIRPPRFLETPISTIGAKYPMFYASGCKKHSFQVVQGSETSNVGYLDPQGRQDSPPTGFEGPNS